MVKTFGEAMSNIQKKKVRRNNDGTRDLVGFMRNAMMPHGSMLGAFPTGGAVHSSDENMICNAPVMSGIVVLNVQGFRVQFQWVSEGHYQF